MSYLPQNSANKKDPKPWTPTDQANQTATEVLNNIIPHDPNKPYDMAIAIEAIADRNEFYQIMPNFAKNIMTGFIEVEGKSVGVVANQP